VDNHKNQLELFVQGEGLREIALVRVAKDGTVRDVLQAAQGAGALLATDTVLSLEDEETSLDPVAAIAATAIQHRSRVHIHRCRRVAVTVTFNGVQKHETFPPAATVKRVKRWAVGKHGFDLSDVDAAEHVLQLSGSSERPDEDAHIGTLVAHPRCSVSFDLVPKIRVEG